MRRRPQAERLRTDEFYRIPDAHDPARDDASAEAAEAGVFGLVDAAEAALQKRAGDLGAGRGVAGDQQADRSDLQGRARTEGGPVDPRNGEVFARTPSGDRMPFLLERADHIERVEDDGAVRSAV